MIVIKSEITKKLLNYFFLNPEENLYINELSRKLDLDKRNLVKKLRELEKKGILRSQSRGNLRLYSINKAYCLYNEYKKIVLKTLGFEPRLKEILAELGEVEKAYIYGSYASDNMNAHSDIDLLVIGSHSIVLLQRKLTKLQKETGRQINIVNMDSQELRKRIKNRDPYIKGIFKNKHIAVAL